MPTSLRAEKKRRTRQALARHALLLFSSQGFEATTVDEIAAAAEVSRRTFFRYFATKEAVVFDAQEERLEVFRNALEQRVADETAYQAMRRALRTVAEVYAEDRDDVVNLYRIVSASQTLTAREHQMDRRYEEVLAKRLADGAVTPEGQLYAAVTAGALIGALRVILHAWTVAETEASLQQMGDEILDHTLERLRGLVS